MDFMEAVKAMKDGNKVKRKGDGDIWYMNNDLIQCKQNPIVRPIYQDYIATDWEIYKEEKRGVCPLCKNELRLITFNGLCKDCAKATYDVWVFFDGNKDKGDNWNLADEIRKWLRERLYAPNSKAETTLLDIFRFNNQKVKEDNIKKRDEKTTDSDYDKGFTNAMDFANLHLDKRAGRL